MRPEYTEEQMRQAVRKKKTFYQFYKIHHTMRGFTILDDTGFCSQCNAERGLCKVGMMGDYKYGYRRCAICLLKVPAPLYWFRINRAKLKVDPYQKTL